MTVKVGRWAAGVAGKLAGCVMLGVIVSAMTATLEVADWSSSSVVDWAAPVLGFGPSGDAAIASTRSDLSNNMGGSVYVTMRPAHGQFSSSTVLAPSAYRGDANFQSEPAAIALPAGGRAALLFEGATPTCLSASASGGLAPAGSAPPSS